MCGMCLPYCPTYRVYRNEAESPRGRIALMNALAQERIAPQKSSLTHLDHCLGCMACEAVCPSKVPYSELHTQAYELLQPAHASMTSWPVNHLLKTIKQPGGLGKYSAPLRWYKRSGLANLARPLLRLTRQKSLLRAHSLLNEAHPQNLATFYPARGTPQGDIALFTGCMGKVFDADTLKSCIELLSRLGYNVHVPANQNCCGALHQQHGRTDDACELEERNHDIFSRLDISHIIYTASGCGPRLQHGSMPVTTTDILSFVLSSQNLAKLAFLPLQAHVMIHESCSRRYKLKTTGLSRQLLQRIPEIELHEVAANNFLCCGAGGSHQLGFPDLADNLLSLKLAEIRDTKLQYLVSDNIGCSMHFKAGLKKQGMDIEILHPVTLLLRQLG